MKTRLLFALVGLAIGFALPVLAQEQNTVDPELRQQIEAVLMKFDDAYNKHDAAATPALYTQDAVHGNRKVDWLPVGKPSRKSSQSTSRQVPATRHTSFFRCMQSAMRYARSRNGISRRLLTRNAV